MYIYIYMVINGNSDVQHLHLHLKNVLRMVDFLKQFKQKGITKGDFVYQFIH